MSITLLTYGEGGAPTLQPLLVLPFLPRVSRPCHRASRLPDYPLPREACAAASYFPQRRSTS